ncbi:MAG: hypothetical protein HQL30_09135, partial [Candidatus Omnitrophica bacterium]|nr:hypothetical protein [Candidatus Omnitrophota bacterium]
MRLFYRLFAYILSIFFLIPTQEKYPSLLLSGPGTACETEYPIQKSLARRIAFSDMTDQNAIYLATATSLIEFRASLGFPDIFIGDIPASSPDGTCTVYVDGSGAIIVHSPSGDIKYSKYPGKEPALEQEKIGHYYPQLYILENDPLFAVIELLDRVRYAAREYCEFMMNDPIKLNDPVRII